MIAFVFPGQGSQKPGMGRELAARFPGAKAIFERADDALGFSISRLCFDGPEDSLKKTAYSQPAILTVSIALLEVLQQMCDLRPDVVAGHSLGEYTALVCAEALGLEDAVRLVHQRGLLMQEAVPEGSGSMAALIGLDEDEVEAICTQVCAEGARAGEAASLVFPANYNGGRQIVVAGHTAAVEQAMARGREQGARVVPLRVSAPFHCTLMAQAAEGLEEALCRAAITDLKLPVISNVDAKPYTKAEEVAARLVQQVTAPVRWEQSLRCMVSMGVDFVVEVGPGRALSSLARRIDKNLRVRAVEDPEGIEIMVRERS